MRHFARVACASLTVLGAASPDAPVVPAPVAATEDAGPTATIDDQVDLAGEDRIDHTPENEKLTLRIGTAFDLVCERRQTDFERVAENVYELAFAIALRNHKAAPVTVEVNEPIAGDWRILDSSHSATKTDAFAARFLVAVPPNGESRLTYRVRVRY
jgi:hypothetical protein